MTNVFVGIVIGMVLGLIGTLLHLRVGTWAVVSFGIAITITAGVILLRTGLNVGLFVILVLVYSTTMLGSRALLSATRGGGQHRA